MVQIYHHSFFINIQEATDIADPSSMRDTYDNEATNKDDEEPNITSAMAKTSDVFFLLSPKIVTC